MRQYSQLFCLGLQIWISEMLQYYPELEAVELVQDVRNSQETFLPSLVKFCSAVLKKKMKMLFPIGFQCTLYFCADLSKNMATM
jgi:hypothetical protein